MRFKSIEEVLYECNYFFKPVEDLYKTPIGVKVKLEAECIKALDNTMGFLKGEIRC